MKKLAIIFAFMFLLFRVFAQSNSDANDYFPSPDDEIIRNEILQKMKTSLKSGSIVAEVPAGILYFRVKFHIISNTDGIGGVNPDVFPKVLNMLNQAYKPANIQFVSCASVDYIKNDTYYFTDNNVFTINWTTIRNTFNDNNAINLYFLETLSNRGAMYPGNYELYLGLIRNDNALISVPHEVGHFFGLQHTFDERTEIINGEKIIIRENVARSGVNCNCETEGDHFCDTEADVVDDIIKPMAQWQLISPEYTFSGMYYDKFGGKYNPDVKNIMSYYLIEDWFSDGTLISHFSHQQCVYMREYANRTWAANLTTVPIADKTYSANTTLSPTNAEPVILRNIMVNSPAILTVNACETFIEGTLQINNGSTLEIK